MAGEAWSADELAEFAQSLRSLAPRSTLDRDRLIFLAGRASAVRSDPLQRVENAQTVRRPREGGHYQRRWLWPAATVVSTVCAIVLGAMLASRHPSPIDERENRLADERPRPAGTAEGPDVARVTPDVERVAPTPANNSSPPLPHVRETGGPEHFRKLSAAPSNYLSLRDLVLSEGIDAWKSDRPDARAGSEMPSEPRPVLRAGDRPGRGDPMPSMETILDSHRSSRGATL
ncbi:MAG: hypothetical protein KY476_17515 [Planctomycetes bacterium]|nr:hypothetical protein [Planctomycetota bacterium]